MSAACPRTHDSHALRLGLCGSPAPSRVHRNYGCECKVAQIIAREAELQPSVVGRRPWKATTQFERRWLTDDDKAKLVELAQPPEH